MSELPQGLRAAGVRVLENVPPAYCAIMRRRHPEWLVVDRRCDLVIEGYQSSGNTFARKLSEQGLSVSQRIVVNRNHMDSVRDLGVPHSLTGRYLAELIKSAA